MTRGKTISETELLAITISQRIEVTDSLSVIWRRSCSLNALCDYSLLGSSFWSNILFIMFKKLIRLCKVRFMISKQIKLMTSYSALNIIVWLIAWFICHLSSQLFYNINSACWVICITVQTVAEMPIAMTKSRVMTKMLQHVFKMNLLNKKNCEIVHCSIDLRQSKSKYVAFQWE